MLKQPLLKSVPEKRCTWRALFCVGSLASSVEYIYGFCHVVEFQGNWPMNL